MDQPAGSGSAPSRPRSVSPVSGSNINVFDDEFAEDYAESFIAPSIRDDDDPFADPSDTTPTASVHHLPLTPTVPSDPAQQHPRQQRDSIRKPREDAETNGASYGLDPFQRGSIAHRTNSTSSLAPPLSPTDDEQGPSHPYAMYPQVLSISRTGSIATTSTVRSPSSPSQRANQGPTHPYALYPQDVFGDSSDGSSTSIPVGFPGHTQHFHRRRDVEGEEQEIIGLDGHAEQLPPYTRYPETALTKPPGSGSRVPLPLPMINEASQSTDNLVEMRQVSEVQSSAGSGLGGSPGPPPQGTTGPFHSSPFSSSSSSPPEMSWKDKNWQGKLRHKIWGIVPLWIILLVIAVIVIIIAVCGGFINAYKNKQTVKEQNPYAAGQGSPTPISSESPTYVDANPISGPTNTIAPLPTGIFEIKLGDPDAKFNACLNSTQMKAWSCNLPRHNLLTVSISNVEERWFLDTYINGPNQTRSYGTQPPDLRRESLRLVIDVNEKSFGAAYHFQTFYDKLVIIPASFLPQGPVQASNLLNLWPRAIALDEEDAYPPVQPGDEAWFCRWDDTFIEGFIYVSEFQTSTSTSWTSTTTPTLPAYTTPPPPPSPTSPSSTTAPSTSPVPGAMLFKRLPHQQNSSTFYNPPKLGHKHSSTPAAISYSPAMPTQTPGSTPPPDSSTGAGLTTPTSTPTPTTPSFPPPIWSTPSPTTSSLRNLIKFEERRLQGLHGTPVCQLYQMLYNGKFAPKYSVGTQTPILVYLDEDDGGNWLKKYRYRVRRRDDGDSNDSHKNKGYQGDLDDTCYCQWTSFQIPLR